MPSPRQNGSRRARFRILPGPDFGQRRDLDVDPSSAPCSRRSMLRQCVTKLGARARRASRRACSRDDDHRVHRFAPGRIGNAEHRRFERRRVPIQRVFDFDRVHVLAAGHDHVLEPIDDEQVAAVAQEAEIAGVVPAARERRRRRCRRCSSSRPSRSGRARGSRRPRPASHSLPSSRTTRTATPGTARPHEPKQRRADRGLFVAQAGDDRRRLRRAVELRELRAGKGRVRRFDRARSRSASRRGRACAATTRRAARAAARRRARPSIVGTGIATRDRVSLRSDRGTAAGRTTACVTVRRAEPDQADERRDARDVEHRGRGEKHVVGRERARDAPCETRWRPGCGG